MKMNLAKELFYRENGTTENSISVIWRNKVITKGELIRNALKTGVYLKKLGLVPNDKVTFLLYDTPAIFDYFFGAISIGLIPTFINPKTKLEEIKYVISDSNSSLVVLEKFESHLIDELVDFKNNIKVILQDSYTDFKDVRHQKALSINVELIDNVDSNTFEWHEKNESDECFFQYTSGTTGNPTAVIQSSNTFLYYAKKVAEDILGIERTDRIYSTSKVFFGYGFGNVLIFPLWTGAAIVLDSEWPTPRRVIKNTILYKPDVIFSVPKIYNQILELDVTDYTFENVRICFSAGSHLSENLNVKWYNKFGKYIVQGLGSTELGHVYICNSLSDTDPAITGILLDGFEFKLITDDEKQNGSENKMGELYVKAPYVLNGYWNCKKKVNGYLKDNWLKTRDTLEYIGDRKFRFIERSDSLFKINGRFVIPANVEELVLKNFELREAYFVGLMSDEDSDTKSYLCISPLSSLSSVEENELSESIQSFLKEKVSSYCRPHNIVIFEDFNFAYNDNGKVNRQRIIQKITQ